MGFAVSLQGFAFPAARMTPMRGRGFLTLALIALAVLLVQPVCAVLASHAVAGVTAVAPDADASHDVPCCSSIDSVSMVKLTPATIHGGTGCTCGVPATGPVAASGDRLPVHESFGDPGGTAPRVLRTLGAHPALTPSSAAVRSHAVPIGVMRLACAARAALPRLDPS